MKHLCLVLLLTALRLPAHGQASRAYAEQVRQAHHIPELAYAVVAADTVLEMQVLGGPRQSSSRPAQLTDRFHLGSNTKAITALVAAGLVAQGKIAWDTRFLALFPELAAGSQPAYRTITLQDLLTFRGRLPAYTYSYELPTRAQLPGNAATQRYLLAKYFLARPPMRPRHGLTPSNADYVLAGLLLEKATGQSYQQLVATWGRAQGVAFGFGYPNATNPQQPWGQGPNGAPQLPAADTYKLDWLLSAGNLNVTLPDYCRLMQLELRGLQGKSSWLPPATFEMLLFGRPGFAFGWFNKVAGTHHVAYNEGNAGAFLTQVQLIREADWAYVIFTNSATPATAAGVAELTEYLQAKYGR